MIVLDTHVLLWLTANPDQLSDAAAGAITHDTELAVSTISFQEISYLAARGRIELGRPTGRWIAAALRANGVEPVPPGTAIAVSAGALDPTGFPADPADRIIYATALQRGVRLVTADRRIASFDPARVIW